MPKQMLIDGGHKDEIRVAVASGDQIDEYDIQTAFRKQIKSNIYLAKVVRVEPSLQAAFVDYGGDRHGFLAFNDVHPDYYQIPVDDRRRALEEQQLLGRGDHVVRETLAEIDGDSAGDDLEIDGDRDAGAAADPPPEAGAAGPEAPETETGAAAVPGSAPRRYKIQEVIKPKQIILVQVLKEERGSKGAALTTYISLPGRYCVLMPNATRTGGVSRRITGAKERKKLQDTLKSLEIPEGMGLIIRTAGIMRTKAEIRRDLEFLLRAWDKVCEVTLSSTAPCLIHEEGDIVKRSIRDVFTKDIEKVVVAGADTYQAAKQFMRLMMPSQARHVQQYDEAVPLFRRYRIEEQIEALYKPLVELRSGGSLVINQTEALVAIDVNSGRSTGERSTEKTALKTNLEAAEEVARQLRLRDLAGLIVIDFIDMDTSRNVRRVESCLRDALKNDRARIKTGRISEFGLMELSRQRLRPSLIESGSMPCPHCGGFGHVFSAESMALRVLRAVEEAVAEGRSGDVTVAVVPAIAMQILNRHRTMLADIETRHGLRVELAIDDTLPASEFRMTPAPKAGEGRRRRRGKPAGDERAPSTGDGVATAGRLDDGPAGAPAEAKPPRRRRRRKPAGDDRPPSGGDGEIATGSAGEGRAAATDPGDGGPAADASPEAAEAKPPRRRRRRKPAGDDRPPSGGDGMTAAGPADEGRAAATDPGDGGPAGDASPEAAETKAPRRRRRRKPAGDGHPPSSGDEAATAGPSADGSGAGGGSPTDGAAADAVSDTRETAAPAVAHDPEAALPTPDEPEDRAEKTVRRGWWRKVV